jgi:hypothetical protein
MKPLTIQDTRFFTPDQSCLDEEARLVNIADELLARPDLSVLFQNS